MVIYLYSKLLHDVPYAIRGQKIAEQQQQEICNQIEEKYNWDRIAEQTIQVYRKALVHGAKRKGQRGKGR